MSSLRPRRAGESDPVLVPCHTQAARPEAMKLNAMASAPGAKLLRSPLDGASSIAQTLNVWFLDHLPGRPMVDLGRKRSYRSVPEDAQEAPGDPSGNQSTASCKPGVVEAPNPA